MDFLLNEDQTALRDLARQILEDQLTQERLREIEAEGAGFDAKLWADLADANLLGLAVSESHGGMGYGFEELCLLLEEIGRTVAPLPAVATLVMAALPIAHFGTDSQRERFLGRVVSGDALLSAALEESGSNEPARPQTRAHRQDSGWRLDGEKSFVPMAHLAERILVPASCEEGVGIFLVDPKAPGVELERLETTNSEPQFTIRLSGVVVEPEDLLGEPAGGAECVEWIRQRVLAAYAALQVGVSERALRLTAAYTSEREQFGRKLSTFQAVAQRAASAFIDVDALRMTTAQAVWRLAEGMDAGAEVAVAKYWVGECGHRVSYTAQQLHGGIGVDIDYPLHRYCLWSKQLELNYGSSSEQLVELGARLAEERV